VYFEDIAVEHVWTEERWIIKSRIHKVELHNLYSSHNIMRMTNNKSRRMIYTGRVTRVGEILITLVPLIGSGDGQTHAAFVSLSKCFSIMRTRLCNYAMFALMCERRDFVEITFPKRSHSDRALSELTSKPLLPSSRFQDAVRLITPKPIFCIEIPDGSKIMY
jgi:hypothetical protein